MGVLQVNLGYLIVTWFYSFNCHSLSLASVKSRLVLPFWVVLDKGPLNGVCVCFFLYYYNYYYY